MYDLFYDYEKKRYYIILDGLKTYISTLNRVTATYENGDNHLFGGMIGFSKNIYKHWFILNDVGKDYIPLCNVAKIELL